MTCLQVLEEQEVGGKFWDLDFFTKGNFCSGRQQVSQRSWTGGWTSENDTSINTCRYLTRSVTGNFRDLARTFSFFFNETVPI